MSGTYGSNAWPSRRWIWLPFLVAAGSVALFVGGWLFFGSPGPASANGPVYWWFPLGWFFLIPVFFLVFFGLRWFFWGWWGWHGGLYQGARYDPAVEALRERFAKGEITREQYEQTRRDLES